MNSSGPYSLERRCRVKTNNLRTNQLTPAATEWYLSYLAALDAKDVQSYGAFLADDCAMQFNNAPAVSGKAAVLDALAQYWATFGTLEHDLLNIYGTDGAFALEARNLYTRQDGKTAVLNAVAFTDRNAQGLVTSFRLYTDTAPLFDAT